MPLTPSEFRALDAYLDAREAILSRWVAYELYTRSQNYRSQEDMDKEAEQARAIVVAAIVREDHSEAQ